MKSVYFRSSILVGALTFVGCGSNAGDSSESATGPTSGSESTDNETITTSSTTDDGPTTADGSTEESSTTDDESSTSDGTTDGGEDGCGGCPIGRICRASFDFSGDIIDCIEPDQYIQYECVTPPPACVEDPSCANIDCAMQICGRVDICDADSGLCGPPEFASDIYCARRLDICHLFDQDCPYGQKCTPFPQGSGAEFLQKEYGFCEAHLGDAGYGESCTNSGDGDDCAPLLDCDDGVCTASCIGDWSDWDCSHVPDTICLESQNANKCVPTCDPIAQDCGADEGCYPVTAGFVCASIVEPGAAGVPCESLVECDAGNTCLYGQLFPAPECTDSPGCCSPFCDLTQGEGTNNPTCAAMTDLVPDVGCYPFESKPGWEDVGMCRLPP